MLLIPALAPFLAAAVAVLPPFALHTQSAAFRPERTAPRITVVRARACVYSAHGTRETETETETKSHHHHQQQQQQQQLIDVAASPTARGRRGRKYQWRSPLLPG